LDEFSVHEETLKAAHSAERSKLQVRALFIVHIEGFLPASWASAAFDFIHS